MLFKKFILMLMASLLLCGPPRAWTETTQASEYLVKAAFLYHFAQFIEWPADVPGKVPPSLSICVLGKSPFGNALSTISGKKVRNRQVAITYLNQIEELKECDILFISTSEKAKLAQIMAAVASRPILTVSDIKRFVAAGGMIGFVSENDELRFEISQRAAQRSSLRVSAKLLKLAR